MNAQFASLDVNVHDDNIQLQNVNRLHASTTGLLPDGRMSLLEWLPPVAVQPSATFVDNGLDNSLKFRPVSREELAGIAALKVHEEIVKLSVEIPLPNDAMLLRLLVGFRLNFDETLKALMHAMKWKHEHHIDELVSTQPLSPGEGNFKKFHTHQWHGLDNNYHPIFFDRIGVANRKAFFKNVTPLDVSLRYARVQELGLLLANGVSEATSMHVDSFLFVFDLNGLGVLDATNSQVLAMFQSAVSVMQDVYAGTLHQVLIINAPKVFATLWKALVMCIDRASQDKIEVFGSNWRSRILELMPESSLPRYLKGTCKTCQHPDCIPLHR